MFPNRPLHLLGPNEQGYVLTDELKAHLTFFDPKAPVIGIPPAKTGVIVIHPATGRFYSTIVGSPKKYYLTMKKEVPGYNQLALPLQRMLEKDLNFHLYTVHATARNFVEHALTKIGLMRVSTGRGELQGDSHALFKVECPVYKFARFTIAPKNTEDAKLVKKANDSLDSWLEKMTAPNNRLKLRLRDGLGKKIGQQRVVFGTNATVTLVRFVFETPREYTKIVTQLNLDEVQKFLLRATGAVV